MVAMAVRNQEGRRRQAVLLHCRDDFVGLQTRVDHQAIAAAFEPGDVAVLVNSRETIVRICGFDALFMPRV